MFKIILYLQLLNNLYLKFYVSNTISRLIEEISIWFKIEVEESHGKLYEILFLRYLYK